MSFLWSDLNALLRKRDLSAFIFIGLFVAGTVLASVLTADHISLDVQDSVVDLAATVLPRLESEYSALTRMGHARSSIFICAVANLVAFMAACVCIERTCFSITDAEVLQVTKGSSRSNLIWVLYLFGFLVIAYFVFFHTTFSELATRKSRSFYRGYYFLFWHVLLFSAFHSVVSRLFFSFKMTRIAVGRMP